jgi:ribonuclease BN (tRNA processing enzyme)
MLELLILGSGSLLHTSRALSSFVLDRTILFEAPPDVTTTLRRAGLDRAALDVVLVSHLHGDHFGGLPFLFAERDAAGRDERLTIVGPAGLEESAEELYERFFPGAGARRREKRAYVTVRDGEPFETALVAGLARAVVHTADGVAPFGFRVTLRDHVLAYTGDTEWCDAIFGLASGASVLIADCTFPGPLRRAGHLSYEDVLELRERLPPSTLIVLSHLGHEPPDGDVPGIVVPQEGQALMLPPQGGNGAAAR